VGLEYSLTRPNCMETIQAIRGAPHVAFDKEIGILVGHEPGVDRSENKE